jgi:zinc protease
VLERDLKTLTRGGDPRFAVPNPAQIEAITPDGFRRPGRRCWPTGRSRCSFGDFTRAEGIAALQKTFGALAPRSPLAADAQGAPIGFAKPEAAPTILHHQGDANQAAAAVVWPTGGGLDGVVEGRHLDVLAGFANRLMGRCAKRPGPPMRRRSAAIGRWMPAAGGTITASAVAARYGAAVLPPARIAADLAAQADRRMNWRW